MDEFSENINLVKNVDIDALTDYEKEEIINYLVQKKNFYNASKVRVDELEDKFVQFIIQEHDSIKCNKFTITISLLT